MRPSVKPRATSSGVRFCTRGSSAMPSSYSLRRISPPPNMSRAVTGKSRGWASKACCRRVVPAPSNLYRRRVVRIEPIQSLLDPHLLPVPRHRSRHLVLVGQRRAERLLPVLVRFAHHHGGSIPADRLAAGKGGRRIAEIFLQTCGYHVGVLDRHDGALPQKRKRWMTRVTEQADAPPGPAI